MNPEDGNWIALGDCLRYLQEMPENSVDLVYLDPPFNTGRNFSGAGGQLAFSDQWTTRDLGYGHPMDYRTNLDYIANNCPPDMAMRILKLIEFVALQGK